ncbi:unnamed protein product, partial [Mesorhabditis belari]|uniref:Uncharacterized protein n=1 Tax=Mesorhabditis belari TaxID=2138241 RepID=A0AAF3FFM0_9BILA
MDVDLESVEIVFAQKLACGEPPVRARALKALQEWIKQQSARNAFSEKDFMRLCKGLHYVMWMQDKMIMQEELADKIASLIENFNTESERVLYFECLLKSLAKEWKAIDRWRMDKFLMLIRRCVRAVFHYLKGVGWKRKITKMYIEALQRTVISLDQSIPEGFKFHVASLLLDELDLAGKIDKDGIYDFLQPFITLLGNPSTSRYLFESILKEIFSTILLHYAKEMEKENTAEKDSAGAQMDANLKERESIQFDYERIGKALFEVGKSEKCSSERRKQLYNLAKKFELAANRKDPYYEKEEPPEIVLTEEMIQEATQKLHNVEKNAKDERRKFAKARKNRPEKHAFAVLPEIIRDETNEKARKQMKREQKIKKKEQPPNLTSGRQPAKRKLNAEKSGKGKIPSKKSSKKKANKA